MLTSAASQAVPRQQLQQASIAAAFAQSKRLRNDNKTAATKKTKPNPQDP
jgi:hypothetical protein